MHRKLHLSLPLPNDLEIIMNELEQKIKDKEANLKELLESLKISFFVAKNSNSKIKIPNTKVDFGTADLSNWSDWDSWSSWGKG